MNLVLPIPDDIAEGLDGDVARRALEAFAVAEYQAGHLSDWQMCRLLGFDIRYELDGFLKARGVYLDHTLEDVQREMDALDRLGI